MRCPKGLCRVLQDIQPPTQAAVTRLWLGMGFGFVGEGRNPLEENIHEVDYSTHTHKDAQPKTKVIRLMDAVWGSLKPVQRYVQWQQESPEAETREMAQGSATVLAVRPQGTKPTTAGAKLAGGCGDTAYECPV